MGADRFMDSNCRFFTFKYTDSPRADHFCKYPSNLPLTLWGDYIWKNSYGYTEYIEGPKTRRYFIYGEWYIEDDYCYIVSNIPLLYWNRFMGKI
jgi:hypothetical protein